MKTRRPSSLQSRVGKRVLTLVFVAALLPLGVLVVLLEAEVRELLTDQGNRRVAAAAKTYAVGVFDRLLIARETAKYAERPTGGPVAPLADRHFLSLASVRPDGKAKALIGTPPPELVGWAASLAKTGLNGPSRLQRGGDDRVYMAIPAAENRASMLAGELNPAFLWGEEDEVPAGMTPCVIGDDKTRPLFCPSGLGDRLLASMDLGRGQAKLAKVTRRDDGKAFQGIMWPMFMQNEFGLGDWYFVVLAEESELFGTLHAFWRAFVLVVALALLSSFWLSLRQIDGILTPLNQLTARTRGIAAREFDQRVDVASGDEFEELGEALNTMSEELGRQFELADTHSYIDRQILARGELQNVLVEVLARLSRLSAAPHIAALIFDREASDTILAVSFPATEGNPRNAGRVLLGQADRTSMELMREAIVTDGTAPPYLAGLVDPGAARLLLQPILWGDLACGILVLGVPQDRDFDADERRIIAGFADRIAVATSANWRDEKLFFQAHHDALTQLPNRMLFNERLQREIARSAREPLLMAVLFVDLDHFKTVNDTQGHGAGDQLLCVAAERLKSAIRDSDTVARYGGDEFAILLVGLHDPQDALLVAEKIIDSLSVPFSIAGQDSFLSASVGISIFPNDGHHAETLLRNADLAMYRAKAAGRSQCLFFEEEMNAEAVARSALDRELHHAVERRQFELYFQPQISSATGRVVAAEALIRWHHPTRGLVTPGHFIPAAESSGIILEIGRLTLEEACRKLRRWNDQGLHLERLSINVSARQLGRHDFVDLVQASIAGGERPLAIELEITESVLLEETAALLSGLTRLTEMGCTIALDDFGTGFSSMSYLKRLPVHCVKIDREFVMDLDRDPDSHAFVEAIVKMSHALGKRVVAEGVETSSQAAILRGLGCDYLQGYYFSRPIPDADFAKFAREFEAEFAKPRVPPITG